MDRLSSILKTYRQNSKYKNWFYILILIVFAFTLRTLWWPENLFFGFEQGRDAWRITALIQGQDFIVVGPKTDIAGIFHGPHYYYLMALPYLLGAGNPVIASLFLIILGSLDTVFTFLLTKDLTKSKLYGLLAGLLTAVSHEYILYSRWLSNVSPAVLLSSFSLWSMWRWRQSKSNNWWYWLVAGLALASQFQIILTLLFPFMLLVLWFSHWLPTPKKVRVWVITFLIVVIIYAPHLAFNIKYHWITWQAISSFLLASESGGSALSGVVVWIEMLWRQWQNVLFNCPRTLGSAGALTVFTTLVMWLRYCQRHWFTNKLGWLFVWWLMTLPVVFFTDSAKLPQLYVASGLALPIILTLIIQKTQQLLPAIPKKLALFFITAAIISSTGHTVWQLKNNHHVFYRTMQYDLRWEDQQQLLDFIAAQPAVSDKDYAIRSYTIPYYQSEAWDYLWQTFHQQHPPSESPHTIFVIVEKMVDPYWIKTWNEELSSFTLQTEKQFGEIRLQIFVKN